MNINYARRHLLQRNYAAACNNYLQVFCLKHGFNYDDAFWVSNRPGAIAQIADYSVDMTVITTSIDEDAPADEFFRWYDYTLDALDLNLDTPNFHSWLHGCPRASKGQILEIRKMSQDLADKAREMNEEMIRYGLEKIEAIKRKCKN